MATVINAILPMLLLLALGFGLKRSGFVKADAWEGIGQMLYYVFFPALLITRISSADINFESVGNLIVAILIAVLLVYLLVIILQLILRFPLPTFTSVVQCCVRYHTFILFYLASSIFGDEGLAIAGVFTGVFVIVANTLAVSTLTFCLNPKVGFTGILWELVKNPLLQASLLGLAMNLFHISLPPLLFTTLDLLGDPSLSISVLFVGAGLVFKFSSQRILAITVGTVGRMLLLPLIGYTVMTYMGITGTAFAIGMMFCAVPTASQSYVLAYKMKGDYEAMGAMLTTTTLVSLFTLSFVIMATT